MTELFLPDVIHVMETEKILLRMIPRIEAAEKYVFQSSGDLEPETVKNIHLTSEEMIDAGLFHLPFPAVWIEDPWDARVCKQIRSHGFPEGRHFWFCAEGGDRIVVYSVEGKPPDISPNLVKRLYPNGPPSGKLRRHYKFHEVPDYIDLSPSRERPNWTTSFDSPLHSVRQFLVTLATAQADIEVVTGRPWKPKQPTRTRQYGYRVLRILLPGETRQSVDHGVSTGAKRPLHFVSGYVWGKNTLPREKQRWIAPYWRGDVEHGVSIARHREVVSR